MTPERWPPLTTDLTFGKMPDALPAAEPTTSKPERMTEGHFIFR